MTSAPVRRTRWAWWVSTCFGLGYAKPGPGTWTSAAAAILWFPFARLTPLYNWQTFSICSVTLFAALLVTFAGIPASSCVARESGNKDPGFVTVDELAGQWFTLALLPYAMYVSNELHHRPVWGHWTGALAGYTVAAFLLFRLFDIWKPFPIRKLEKMPGGTGIMVDDLGAGIYGALVLVILVLAI